MYEKTSYLFVRVIAGVSVDNSSQVLVRSLKFYWLKSFLPQRPKTTEWTWSKVYIIFLKIILRRRLIFILIWAWNKQIKSINPEVWLLQVNIKSFWARWRVDNLTSIDVNKICASMQTMLEPANKIFTILFKVGESSKNLDFKVGLLLLSVLIKISSKDWLNSFQGLSFKRQKQGKRWSNISQIQTKPV